MNNFCESNTFDRVNENSNLNGGVGDGVGITNFENFNDFNFEF
jgi:hypothetical protein